MDMSKAFIAGAARHYRRQFDGFHVVQLANQAVDAVRREEARGERWSRRPAGGSRQRQVDRKEQDKMDWLPYSRLKTARAWRSRRHCATSIAQGAMQSKVRGRSRSGCTGRSAVNCHPSRIWPRPSSSIGRGLSKRLSIRPAHGYVEAVNSLLQAAKAKARSYGTTDHSSPWRAGKLTQSAGQSASKSKGLSLTEVGLVACHPKRKRSQK